MEWNESIEALKGFVSEAAQAAARVTKGAAAVTKSNLSIFTEQDRQKKAYIELGKLYYRDYITGEEPDDAEYLPILNTLTDCAKNLESLRNELEEAKISFSKSFETVVQPPEEKPVSAEYEEELANLQKELDAMAEDLGELNKLDEAPEAPAEAAEEKAEEKAEEAPEAPVFEVVDEPKPEEPKAEE